MVVAALTALLSCKSDDPYRDNKALSCRAIATTDGNGCERLSWENDKLLRWEIFEGGGCDSVGATVAYEFEYDDNGSISVFRALGEMTHSGRFEYDDAGRPTNAYNSLGEYAQWIYENDRVRRAVFRLRDTTYEVEFDYDAYGNVVRAGPETITYDLRAKNMYSHIPVAALLWIRGVEFASPNQQLVRRNAAGAESGYKAVVSNAQGYPVRLVTLDAGLVTVGYECR